MLSGGAGVTACPTCRAALPPSPEAQADALACCIRWTPQLYGQPRPALPPAGPPATPTPATPRSPGDLPAPAGQAPDRSSAMPRLAASPSGWVLIHLQRFQILTVFSSPPPPPTKNNQFVCFVWPPHEAADGPTNFNFGAALCGQQC